MKKLLVLILSFTIATGGFAQEKGNGKDKKSKDKSYKHSNKSHGRQEKDDENNTELFGRKKEKSSHKRDDDSWKKDGDYENHGGKYSKNQPAKVREAFDRDYPNARDVRWTKNKGNWTATFHTGGLFNRRIKASYHANGEKINAFTTRK